VFRFEEASYDAVWQTAGGDDWVSCTALAVDDSFAYVAVYQQSPTRCNVFKLAKADGAIVAESPNLYTPGGALFSVQYATGLAVDNSNVYVTGRSLNPAGNGATLISLGQSDLAIRNTASLGGLSNNYKSLNDVCIHELGTILVTGPLEAGE
jgi:hypothetical protein